MEAELEALAAAEAELAKLEAQSAGDAAAPAAKTEVAASESAPAKCESSEEVVECVTQPPLPSFSPTPQQEQEISAAPEVVPEEVLAEVPDPLG